MSMKDALKKAGLSSTKSHNERDQKATKNKTKVEQHQEKRNYCEVCDTTQPDVERFKHKSPRVEAEWICSNCADKNEILDQFRMTNQSDFSKTGRYRRYYGPTQDFGTGKDWKAKAKRPDGTRPKKSKKVDPKFTVDDDGEKNFNC
jgi:superfamily II helicase